MYVQNIGHMPYIGLIIVLIRMSFWFGSFNRLPDFFRRRRRRQRHPTVVSEFENSIQKLSAQLLFHTRHSIIHLSHSIESVGSLTNTPSSR